MNDKQIGIRLPDELYGRLSQFADDRDYNDAQAGKRAIDAGLRAEGYHPPRDAASSVLYIVKLAGFLAFLAGLAAIAVGAFTSFDLSILGLGLALGGAVFVALAAVLETGEQPLRALMTTIRRTPPTDPEHVKGE